MKFVNNCRYALKTLRHKQLVFRYGMKTGAPLWRLFIHDWTKFTPSELPHYANQFYGDVKDDIGFAQAWNHHQKSNPHHPEYWIPATSHMLSPVPAGEPLPMPEPVIREMVADWLAASYFATGKEINTLSDWEWFQREKIGLRLHPETWQRLYHVLTEYFEKHGLVGKPLASPSSLQH